MAGIGFELRKYLNDDSFSGTIKAYGFAGLISAGPWVLSILCLLYTSPSPRDATLSRMPSSA